MGGRGARKRRVRADHSCPQARHARRIRRPADRPANRQTHLLAIECRFGPMMLKTLVFTCCLSSLALAQRVAPPATMPTHNPYDHPSPAELMQLNGGSL